MKTLAHVTTSTAGTITTLELDGDTLTPLATSAVAQGVGTMVIDPSGTRAYAAGKDPQAVITLGLDPLTGEWSEIARLEVEAPMAYLSLSHDGGHLLGASYHGGCGLVWPLVDGVPGQPTARVEHSRLHCVVDVAGYVHFVSLGDDLVAVYGLEPETGTLEPLGELAMEPGTGPRHLVFDEAGEHGYLITEFTAEVFHLLRDPETGALEDVDDVTIADPSAHLAVSRLDADPKAEHLRWGADVRLLGEERWLVASERTASTVALVPVADDGSLGDPVAWYPTPTQPRGLMVAPDDRHVVVAGEKDTTAALFALSDGALDQVGQCPTDEGGNWVRFTEQA